MLPAAIVQGLWAASVAQHMQCAVCVCVCVCAVVKYGSYSCKWFTYFS